MTEPTDDPTALHEPQPLLTSAADRAIFDEPFSYVSGTAGTGKTTLAREVASLAKPGQLALCATTGIAAVNLGEGTTINSLLGFFDTDSLKESYTLGYLGTKLRQLKRAGLTRIILDEVSMMDGDQLTMIKRAIDEVNQPRSDSMEGIGDDYASSRHSADDDLPLLGLRLVGSSQTLAARVVTNPKVLAWI